MPLMSQFSSGRTVYTPKPIEFIFGMSKGYYTVSQKNDNDVAHYNFNAH